MARKASTAQSPKSDATVYGAALHAFHSTQVKTAAVARDAPSVSYPSVSTEAKTAQSDGSVTNFDQAPQNDHSNEALEIERVKVSLKLLLDIVHVITTFTPRPQVTDIERGASRTTTHNIYMITEEDECTAPWEPSCSPPDLEHTIALEGLRYENFCHITGMIGFPLLQDHLFKDDRGIKAVKWMYFVPQPRFKFHRQWAGDGESDFPHDVLHLQTVTGKTFVVDPTGAQFGFEGWFITYEEYVRRGYMVPGTERERNLADVLEYHDELESAGDMTAGHHLCLLMLAGRAIGKVAKATVGRGFLKDLNE